MTTWLAPVLALLVSAGTTGFLLVSRLGLRWAPDLPNGRSLHAQPVPRIGGLGMVLAIVMVCHGVVEEAQPILWLAGALCALSLLDDLRGLPLLVRFAGHALAALLFVLWMLPPTSILVMFLLVLSIVWSTNLFNFMDGANGLAGGMALIGFGVLGTVAVFAGEDALALYCLAIAAASLGFLLFNFDPARVFMGDCGSIPLGFLAAVLSLWGGRLGAWSLSLPILAFFPFLADATLTLTKRLLGRERFWLPHRDHYYQRLIRMGLSHRGLALAAYPAMLLSGLAGCVIQSQSAAWQVGGVLAICAAWGIVFYRIDAAWRRFVANGHAM